MSDTCLVGTVGAFIITNYNTIICLLQSEDKPKVQQPIVKMDTQHATAARLLAIIPS